MLAGWQVLNLLLNSDSGDVTKAESFKSAPVVPYPAYAFVTRHAAETNPDRANRAECVRVEYRVRNPFKGKKRKHDAKPTYEAAGDFPYIYGCRPRGTDAYHESPYEFTMDWEAQLLHYCLVIATSQIRIVGAIEILAPDSVCACASRRSCRLNTRERWHNRPRIRSATTPASPRPAWRHFTTRRPLSTTRSTTS